MKLLKIALLGTMAMAAAVSCKQNSAPAPVPEKKVIQPGQEVTLVLKSESGKIPDLNEHKASLVIEDEGVHYDEFGGYTSLSFDLVKKTGTVFSDYDN